MPLSRISISGKASQRGAQRSQRALGQCTMDAITELSSLPEPDAEETSRCLLRLMRGVNAQAFRTFGNKVFNGPFAGMEVPDYNPYWDDGNAGCKLFGSYEHE